MKFPKIYHLPTSPGVQSDDKVLEDLKVLAKEPVVITEKSDGENTSLHNMLETNPFHARSLDSAHHGSRDWIKSEWAKIAYKIPSNIQVIGENVYAEHSIKYDQLTSYFYVFAVYDKEREVFLSWSDVESCAKKLGFPTVPVLFQGFFKDWLSQPSSLLGNGSRFGKEAEGFVVRAAGEISKEQFSRSVAKFVREGHVQTDQHWTKNWKKNELID